MWHSIDLAEIVSVRFDISTLAEGGTVCRCAIVRPSMKVIDLGMCRVKRKLGDDEFEELRLENIESGLRFDFIRLIK